MMDENFNLRWRDFNSVITSSINQLQNKGDFVDVTLITADEIQLKAHKIVLSASSSYFNNVLKNNSCPHPVIVFREVFAEDLRNVLTFIYEGEVNLDKNKLNNFMILANSLKISAVFDQHFSEEKLSVQKKHKLNGSDPCKISENNSKKHKVTENDDSLKRTTSTLPEEMPENSSESVPDDFKIDSTISCQLESFDFSEDQSSIAVDEMDSVVLSDPSSLLESIQEQKVDDPLSIKSDKRSKNGTMETSNENTRQSTHANHVTQIHPCPFCEKTYSSWGFRRRHIKVFHASLSQLPCKWCCNVFPNNQQWENHMVQTHNFSLSEAHDAILILEEAHMVLQVAQPMRIPALLKIIKTKKPDETKPK